MKNPKYKLAFPGKHVLVFNGHPVTQFDGYTLGTYASGNGIVSASKQKGFWGESAELFQSAAQYHTFDGYSANKGTVNGNTYIFGKGDDIVTAFFNETEIYNLFLNQTKGGTITGNPMTGRHGQYIVLSALPSSHYTFNGYSVTGGVLSGDKIIIGNSDMTAQASWIEDPKYSLTIQQTNGGIVTANKSTGYEGDQVTLSNTPSSHYTFGSYSLTGATLTGNKFNFVNQNVTAKGTFIQDPIRSVTLQQTSGGTITANPMTGYDDTVVTLSNTANAGYTFNSYSITGGTLTGNQFTLNGGDVTVKPNYTHNVYNLTLQTNGNGKLAAGKTTGYYNDTTTLTATPSSNYKFNNYSVTGGTITNNTFKWGTSNATAKANFSYVQPSATYSKYIKVHAYLWTSDRYQQYMLSSNTNSFGIEYNAKDNNTDMDFYDYNYDYGSYITSSVSPVCFYLYTPNNQNSDIIFRLYSTASNPKFYFERVNHLTATRISWTANSLSGPWTECTSSYV